VLLQRDRPVFGHDHVGVAAYGLQPIAELLGVRHGRREGHETDLLWEVDDDLLPHGTAESVGEVVHLVHHHVCEAIEERRVGVQHVPQDLGGHHDDAGAGVHIGVAREKADVFGAPHVDELLVLLVAEGLDGRGVEDLGARLLHRQEHGELRHDRLACAGGCGNEHAAPFIEGGAARPLERIEVELQPCSELRESRLASLFARPGVSLSR
jgi:hypothetical protein